MFRTLCVNNNNNNNFLRIYRSWHFWAARNGMEEGSCSGQGSKQTETIGQVDRTNLYIYIYIYIPVYILVPIIEKKKVIRREHGKMG